MSLEWRGEIVMQNMRDATRIGVNQTMSDAVDMAKTIHTWKNRTGILEGSIRIHEFAHLDGHGYKGTWGSRDVRYALIHEIGGVIRPKASKFLAIPVSGAAKSVGSPRDMSGLAFVQSLKGQPLLMDDNQTVHFVLKRQVVIPARPYLRPAADATYPGLRRNISRAFERLTGFDKRTGRRRTRRVFSTRKNTK